MDLARDDYLSRLDPNWGKIHFERMKARELSDGHAYRRMKCKSITPALKQVILSLTTDITSSKDSLTIKPVKNTSLDHILPGDSTLYESVTQSNSVKSVATDTIDISDNEGKFSEEEFCHLLSLPALKRKRVLIMQNWKHFQTKILRCISIELGEVLEEINLSNTSINSSDLEVLLPRTFKLRILILSNCRDLDVRALQVITKISHKTLNELYINLCPCVHEEALLWISGSIGFNQPKLKKLALLDLSETLCTDNGLIGTSRGCKMLQYINLRNCYNITDLSVIALAKSCKKLQLLNLTNCRNITNKALIALGQHSHSLASVTFSKCVQVDDRGLMVLAAGCNKLQSLNLSCCVKITEKSICAIVENCKGLLMLNVSGCPEITVNGINSLVVGLQYVQLSTTFVGFCPIDSHVARKLDDQIQMIKGQESYRHEKMIRDQIERERNRAAAAHLLEDKAALSIQRYLYSYSCRMKFYRIWESKCRKHAAITLQRIYRGRIGRRIALERYIFLENFSQRAIYAIRIQKTLRGYFFRKHNVAITKALYNMYRTRRMQGYSIIAVRLQTYIRRLLAKRRVNRLTEESKRLKAKQNAAAIILQRAGRGYIARSNMDRLRHVVLRQQQVRAQASNYIKFWYRERKECQRLRSQGQELFKRLKKMKESATNIQRVFRGYEGRKSYHRCLIELAVRHRAATMIQAVYRGAKVLHWKDIKMNTVAAFVLDRHYVDRKYIVSQTRLRYQQFIYDVKGDSGSEPDDDTGAIEWIKAYDPTRKRNYWYNNVNTDITFNEPRSNLAHEYSLVGLRVKVYWVVQKTWYEGLITRFQPKSQRHRISYDDGDREWLHLEKEHERIQIQDSTGSWMLYQLYESPAMKNEQRKIRDTRNQEDYKRQAFADALQWKLIQSDHSERNNHDIIFLSQTTGEMRKGVKDALNWVVQDDGFGFPCFYNIISQEVEHEDPRFEMDGDESITAQRNYVMQELRYSLYFCSEFWEQYSQALATSNTRQQHLLCLQVCKSLKPKHLSSFLIRAQELYKPTSIVDKPIHQDIVKELEYASFISSRMIDMAQRGEEVIRQRKEDKKRIIESFEQES